MRDGTRRGSFWLEQDGHWSPELVERLGEGCEKGGGEAGGGEAGGGEAGGGEGEVVSLSA